MSRRADALRDLACEPCDVAIIGGGIYGAMLLLEAAGRGLRATLVERRDFGAETSFNSLRILHGGLRYLQSLDVSRSLESIRERRWFMRTFPELVRPLPCLMPLYGQGLRRPSTMRIALGIDRLLSRRRNAGLPADRHLPPGRVIDPIETERRFAGVDRDGLRGAALWHDASVPDTQRLLMEILGWAVASGATAANYTEAVDLMIENARVVGLVAEDTLTGERLEIRSEVVINATGPSCEALASRFDPGYRPSAYPSLAWNVLFDRAAPSDCTLGVACRRPGAQVYFLHSWKGRLLAGTGHAPARRGTSERVSEGDLSEMVSNLNEAVPGLELGASDILHVFSGMLPVQAPGSLHLTKRPIVHDHGRQAGPAGLVSVSGIKLGGSRVVAERALREVAARYLGRTPKAARQLVERPGPRVGWQLSPDDLPGLASDAEARAGLRKIVEAESAVHLDDLVLRRTTLWEDPGTLLRHAPLLASLFDWDAATTRAEISRLADALAATGARLP